MTTLNKKEQAKIRHRASGRIERETLKTSENTERQQKGRSHWTDH
jgi:hypothetical protein